MDKDKLWNEFAQTGSVESYLIYAKNKDESCRIAQDDGNRRIDNQVNQIR
ncbi:MAG: hypothetical protein PHE51_00965 [Eubacteriales bacterium]|nr:hypothetical protein [Eubacteriales bacterium]